MNDLNLVPQNALLHRLHEMERAHLDDLVSKYSSGKLQPLDALVAIGVLAGMRKHRRSLEHIFLKSVEQAEHIVNQGE